MKATDKPTDIVSLYRCQSCGNLRICEKGNHHPWCLLCMYDIFDWSNGIENITRQEAEAIQEKENR